MTSALEPSRMARVVRLLVALKAHPLNHGRGFTNANLLVQASGMLRFTHDSVNLDEMTALCDRPTGCEKGSLATVSPFCCEAIHPAGAK